MKPRGCRTFLLVYGASSFVCMQRGSFQRRLCKRGGSRRISVSRRIGYGYGGLFAVSVIRRPGLDRSQESFAPFVLHRNPNRSAGYSDPDKLIATVEVDEEKARRLRLQMRMKTDGGRASASAAMNRLVVHCSSRTTELNWGEFCSRFSPDEAARPACGSY